MNSKKKIQRGQPNGTRPIVIYSTLALMTVFMMLLKGGMVLAHDATDTLELSIENAFIPEVGFDDNDNIQVVVVGQLPNICYELGATKVTKNNDGKGINIQQFAHRRNVPGCEKLSVPAAGAVKDDVNSMSSYINWPVAYQKEVSLGKLAAGDYGIQFKGVRDQTGPLSNRHFKVEKGTSANVDELLYAPVTSAFIPEMVYETDNGEAVLTGVLSFTCLKLEPSKIKIQNEGDVIVVLPEMTVDKNIPCSYSPRPINEVIGLGALKEGKYLLHVRSLSGLAVNRVFNVAKQPETERRE